MERVTVTLPTDIYIEPVLSCGKLTSPEKEMVRGVTQKKKRVGYLVILVVF